MTLDKLGVRHQRHPQRQGRCDQPGKRHGGHGAHRYRHLLRRHFSDCERNLPVNGLATVTVSGFQAGPESLTATYSGDGNFTGSSSPAVTDNVAFTKTISGSSSGALTVASGQSVLITGSVSGIITVNSGGALEVEKGRVSGSVTALRGRFTFRRRDSVGRIVGLKTRARSRSAAARARAVPRQRSRARSPCPGTRRRAGGYQHHQRCGFCRQQLRHRTDPARGFGDRGDRQHHQRVAVLLTNTPGVTDNGTANKASSKSGQCAALLPADRVIGRRAVRSPAGPVESRRGTPVETWPRDFGTSAFTEVPQGRAAVIGMAIRGRVCPMVRSTPLHG